MILLNKILMIIKFSEDIFIEIKLQYYGSFDYKLVLQQLCIGWKSPAKQKPTIDWLIIIMHNICFVQQEPNGC